MMRFLTKLAAAGSMMLPAPSYAFSPSSFSGVQVPPHERIVLGNGVKLLIVPHGEVPLISFNAVLQGGAIAGPADKPGVASLFAGLMEKGAGTRDAYAFAEAVEGVGGSFHASASAEAVSIGGQFLARDQALMLELLADALMRPHLNVQELDKLRTRQIEQIKAAKDSDPSELLGIYGRALLFGGHPYAQPVIGGESSLAAIRHGEIRDYYRKQVGADRLTLVFAGRMDAQSLKTQVRKIFGRWRKAAAPAPRLAAPAPAPQRGVFLIDSPGSTQSYFWIGSIGVDKRYPRRAALDLVNTLYGGRFTSLLNTELRIKSGLSYGATSAFNRGSVAGDFSLRSFTQTENTDEALDLSLDTLARLSREGVSKEMLDSARAYVVGQFPLSLETAADWAVALGELELYGLDKDHIEGYGPALGAVSLADAKAVIADAFPAPDEVSIAIIGDAERIRGGLRRFGPVSEIPLTAPAFAA